MLIIIVIIIFFFTFVYIRKYFWGIIPRSRNSGPKEIHNLSFGNATMSTAMALIRSVNSKEHDRKAGKGHWSNGQKKEEILRKHYKKNNYPI